MEGEREGRNLGRKGGGREEGREGRKLGRKEEGREGKREGRRREGISVAESVQVAITSSGFL